MHEKPNVGQLQPKRELTSSIACPTSGLTSKNAPVRSTSVARLCLTPKIRLPGKLLFLALNFCQYDQHWHR